MRLVALVQSPAGRLPDGGDHAQPDVALVADVAGRVGPRWQVGAGRVEQAVGPDGGGVMDASGQGVGHPRQGPGQRAGDLDVEAGPAVLAGAQLGVVPPVPAGQDAAVDDQGGGGGSRSSTVGTFASSARASRGV